MLVLRVITTCFSPSAWLVAVSKCLRIPFGRSSSLRVFEGFSVLVDRYMRLEVREVARLASPSWVEIEPAST